jgi:hypothetical protein
VWLREPAAPDQVKREFLLKVLLARTLEPDMLKEHLERRRQETRGLSGTLGRLHAQPSRQVNGHHTWVIEYALEMCEAEIRWLDHMERALLAGEIQEEDISVAGPG